MSDLVNRLREEARKCEQARHTHWVDPDGLTEAADEIEKLRAALMWTFDRLSIDGGMTAKEQTDTMREIGKVLCGRPSPAATYKPNDWDASAALGEAKDE